MDYYSTLGLNRGASDEDIKKAYRKLAMKHHPDRGGDERKFKEVEEAYRTLSDPQKKQIVDLGGDPNQQQGGFHNEGPFEFHFGSGNFHDIFSQFGFGHQGFRQRRNSSLSIHVQITLDDVLTGKDINAEIGPPGGRTKIVNISIPKGIESGQQIRYPGMGDQSYADAPAGDLLVNVVVLPHPEFRRERNSIICEKTISVWEALLGTNIEIRTLDKKTLNLTIPSGTQPETVLSCRGEGLPDIHNHIRGDLLVKIKVKIPKNLNADQLNSIKSLKDTS